MSSIYVYVYEKYMSGLYGRPEGQNSNISEENITDQKQYFLLRSEWETSDCL